MNREALDCAGVKPRLLELVYRELKTADETLVRNHVVGCDACRKELESLERTCRLLDGLRAGKRQVADVAPREQSEPALDLARLYRTAAQRQQHSRRRWRAAALAACAAAVLVAGLATLRLRVEYHPTHLVLSWGPAREAGTPAPDSIALDRMPIPEGVDRVRRLEGADRVAGPERAWPSTGARSPRPSQAQGVPPPATSAAESALTATLKSHAERLAALDEIVRLLVTEIDSSDARHRRALAALHERLNDLRLRNDLRWALVRLDVSDLGEYVVHTSPQLSDASDAHLPNPASPKPGASAPGRDSAKPTPDSTTPAPGATDPRSNDPDQKGA